MGKPRIGRPPGSRTALSSLAQVRNLYIYLHKEHGYSLMAAGALVKRELGVTINDLMVQTWRDMGLLGKQRKPRHDLTPYRAIRGRTLITEAKK